MRGLFPAVGLWADRSLRVPHRQIQCGACKALRDALGGLGPTLHRNDLTVLAMLGPRAEEPQQSTWCSALPWLRVGVAQLEPRFRRRLVALAALIGALEDTDRRQDGQRGGLLGWVRRRCLKRPRLQALLHELGLDAAQVEHVATSIARTESVAGLPLLEHLAPIRSLGEQVFQRLYTGLLLPDPASRLGSAYVSVLCMLDAHEDRAEDAACGRFNLWDHAADAPAGAPGRVLQEDAQALGSLLLTHVSASQRPLVRHLLETGLGPRVAAALGEVRTEVA